MSFFQNGSIVQQIVSTVTSGGTLTLTASSKQYQVLTGTSTHIVRLPDATTMKNGMVFTVINDSTGAVTVNYNDGSLAVTVDASTSRDIVLIDNSTSNGSFDISTNSSSGGGASQADLNTLRAGALKAYSTTSSRLVFNPEEIGSNTWTSKSGMPAGRVNIQPFKLNGFGYVSGGANAGFQSTTFKYSDDNNSWLSSGTLNVPRHSAFNFSLNGFGYTAGGSSSGVPDNTSTEKFNDLLGTWSTVGSLNIGRNFGAGFALDYGYAAAGFLSGTPTNALEMYNDSTNIWTLRSVLTTGRREVAAFVLNNKGYVIGGVNSVGAVLSTIEVFDELNNTWSAGSSTPAANTQGSSVFSINGLGYYAGGNSSNTYEYNPLSAAWTQKAVLSVPHIDSGAFDLNGSAYICGGDSVVATVEQYRNSNAYKVVSLVKKVPTIPTNIYISAKLNDLATSVPAQIRTDGDNWKKVVANDQASVLKLGETLAVKFATNGLGFVTNGYNGSTIASTEYYNDSANTWTNKTSSSVAKADVAGFAINDKAFKVGGGDASVAAIVATNERYTDIIDTWLTRTSANTARNAPFSFALNGNGYLAGGYTAFSAQTTSTEKFNDTNNAWTTLSAVLGTARGFGAAWSLLGKGYAVVGTNSSGGSASLTTFATEQFDDVLGTWVTKASASQGGRAQSGQFGYNSYGYLLGGTVAGSIVGSSERYNPQTDSWSAITSLGTTGRWFGSFKVNGFGYVSGGGAAQATTQQYNDGANTWSTKANLNTAREQSTSSFTPGTYRNYEVRVEIPALISGVGAGVWTNKATLLASGNASSGQNGANLNGYGYMTGGFDGGNLSTAYKYDLYNNVWSKIASLSTARAASAAFSFLGYLYSLGGTNGSYLASAEKYDDSTLAFSAIASMNTARGGAAVFDLNGFGYIANNESPVAASLELYDQALNTWTNKTAGPNAVATSKGQPLNGFGYVAGGNDGSSVAQNTNAQYNDASNAWTAKATLSTAQAHAGSFLSRNLFYMFGAIGASTLSQKYSDSVNIWYTAPSMSTAREYPIGFAIGDASFAMGGVSSLTSMEQFTPSLTKLVVAAALELN